MDFRKTDCVAYAEQEFSGFCVKSTQKGGTVRGTETWEQLKDGGWEAAQNSSPSSLTFVPSLQVLRFWEGEMRTHASRAL